MKALLVIMTGIGFTLGVVLGLLLHLPTDSLPAEHGSLLSSSSNSRQRRNAVGVGVGGSLDINYRNSAASSGSLGDPHHAIHDVTDPLRLSPSVDDDAEGGGDGGGEDTKARLVDPRMNATAENANKRNNEISGKEVQRSPRIVPALNGRGKQDRLRLSEEDAKKQSRGEHRNPVFDGELVMKQSKGINSFNQLASPDESLNPHTSRNAEIKGVELHQASGGQTQSPEDNLYLKSLVHGVFWTDKLEQSCPCAFKSAEVDAWRKRAASLDVVKMEDGCGRMQNRLLTFRDASKACARYRLNTDQIQGEIFSYYLAKLLKISNLPPTSLALVNSVDRKWRTIHLDLSLAQWADSKLVVLTQYIDGLEAAHIPQDFREDHRKLHPILAHLGTKGREELCELVQWSDLIVFDYLTANLDRVINNMFNRQWNDQIMESPAHNLEKFKDGKLVFLDNESGLFHGFRLLDKYDGLHRALLDSLCIFRSSTASAIKRLATSGTVGSELRALLQQHEPLYRHVANLPQKNVKILQRRIEQVNEQITKCEKMFNS